MLCLMLRSKCFSGRAYFHCTQWATDTECSPPRTQVHSFIHGAEIHKCICNCLYKQSAKFSTSSLAWNHELCRLTCSLWVRFSFKILPLFPLSLKKKKLQVPQVKMYPQGSEASVAMVAITMTFLTSKSGLLFLQVSVVSLHVLHYMYI